MVVLEEMTRVEDVGDIEGVVFREVAEGNVGIASLLQLVLGRRGAKRGYFKGRAN